MPGSTNLCRAGLKATSSRVKVPEVLITSTEYDCRLSAEDMYRQLLMPELDIDTSMIYRMLGQLVDVGMLLHHMFEAGYTVYELDEDAYHDHLICLSCGHAEEFRDSAIKLQQKRVANERGSVLRGHALTPYDVCPTCQTSTGAAGMVVLNA